MEKLRKNILLCILISFSAMLSLELCVFAFFDHHQVRIENVSNESGSDLSNTSESDIDHDDIRDLSSMRSFDLSDLKAVRIIGKAIQFSGNIALSVWLPPKVS